VLMRAVLRLLPMSYPSVDPTILWAFAGQPGLFGHSHPGPPAIAGSPHCRQAARKPGV